MKDAKSKIISKLPTLAKVIKLESRLKEEKVTELKWDEEGDISYKGRVYITLSSSNYNIRIATEKVKKLVEKSVEKTLDDKTKEFDAKLATVEERLKQSLQRESGLRKELIEAMKLNNALNSRTTETKTIVSEPIEIKPIRKKKEM